MTSTVGGPFDNHILYKALRVHGRPYYTPIQKRLLNLSDTLISLFIIGPLVILYWRSTWQTLDKYFCYRGKKHSKCEANLFSDRELWDVQKSPQIYHPIMCFIIGAVIHCCFCLLREPLHSNLSKSRSQVLPLRKIIQAFLAKKIYTYVFSIGCIMHWYLKHFRHVSGMSLLTLIFHAFTRLRRGGWDTYDEYLGNFVMEESLKETQNAQPRRDN
jgi:Fuseless